MHEYYAQSFLDTLSDLGVSELTFRSELHERTNSPHQALFLKQDQIAIELAMELTNDPQLGLKFGSRLKLTEQGIFGYAVMSSACVLDALKLLIRYSQIILPSVEINLSRSETGASLIISAAHLPQKLEQFYCEAMMASIMYNGSILIDEPAGHAQVNLSYIPQNNLNAYEKYFSAEVSFAANDNSIFFSELSLQSKISTANLQAVEAYRKECDRLFSLDINRGSLVKKVKQKLISLGSEYPNCASMARQLHTSESTLRRRLKAEGMNYQTVMDQVRYRMAREYLFNTLLPVSEIAYLLGFSDSSNFRRSFRRWSGSTPAKVRKAIQSSQGDAQSPTLLKTNKNKSQPIQQQT